VTQRDPSDVCLSCGICCTGAFFLKVEVAPEEAACVAAVGIDVEKEGPRHVFPLPCSALDGKACGIYAVRPGICRAFMCKLLDEYAAEHVTLAEAQAITGRLVKIYVKALGLVNGDLRFLWKLVHTKMGDPEFQALLGSEAISMDLAEKVKEIRGILNEHFRKVKKAG